MMRYLHIKHYLIFGLFMLSSPAFAAPIFNFDEIPVTADNALPGSSAELEYKPTQSFGQPCWNQVVGNTSFCKGSFRPTFGYLEISDFAVKGHSLEYVITGGGNPAQGVPLQNKETYLDLLSQGIDPVSTEGKRVGSPWAWIYADQGLPEAAGANRLSYYIYQDPEQTAFTYGPPTNSAGGGTEIYIYTDVKFVDIFPNWVENGGDPDASDRQHLYQTTPVGGGGWAHISVDSKIHRSAANSNGAPFPYPGRSYRAWPNDQFFDNIWRIALFGRPDRGTATPLHTAYYDEFDFINDPEPQNTETIATPGILYVADVQRWEVGFNSKYTSTLDNGTYELRYSFTPITNANWNSAQPVVIQHGDLPGIGPHVDPVEIDQKISDPTGAPGRFRAIPNQVNFNVWAPFTLLPTDNVNLTVGNTVYFAIKDVGQINGNGMSPINGDSNAGRDYAGHPGSFDYAGDQPAMSLIRRLDYYIAEGPVGGGDTTSPLSPVNLTLSN
jgi:hypothetical protein